MSHRAIIIEPHQIGRAITRRIILAAVCEGGIAASLRLSRWL